VVGIAALAAVTAGAYSLPELPPMPAVAAGVSNSVPMGDPAAFGEVKMGFEIETNGPFHPTWDSISGKVAGNGAPEWWRQTRFGIWLHYGPQANGASGDWYAQHMYQQGSTPYTNHLNQFGHPSTNGFKEVIRSWSPTNYNPAGLAQLFYNAGARVVLVQGVHHDNFDNWNSRYNPWNTVNFGARRDTMAEWKTALHALGMRMGVAFHHEYSWWFYQPAFLRDGSGPLAGMSYDAVTATNSSGNWWAGYDTRRLYNLDLHKYQGIATPTSGYWNPGSGVFTNDLDYCYWYATQWGLRMLDVVESYDPDFIYTDGNSTQPFSGYATGTGYKCDAMQRVIAHLYNRALGRRGVMNALAVVKFHSGDHIGTTFEGGYSSAVKTDQPWFAEMAYGDWFWSPGISYDNGGAIVYRLLEAVARDGSMLVNVPNRPDGALDSGATNMLAGVGQWMAVHAEGIYGSRAWVKPAEGSFRFTVGSNGCLYAYYLGIPSAGTQLTIASLGSGSNLLAGAIGAVSLLGSGKSLSWSQSASGLSITCPTPMPTLPSGTAVGFKIGPAAAVGSAAPDSLIASPQTNQIVLSWNYPYSTGSFKVKRAADGENSYTLLASGITNLSFADSAAASGVLYRYVVSAVGAAGESVNSSEASATLAGAASSRWLSEDIGTVGLAGSFGLNGSVFTVQGAGADIWYNADAFRYVFQALRGDCSITARVLKVQNTAAWAKAGVMIRETLDAGAKYVISFVSPSSGAALQQRSSSGGSASGVSEIAGMSAPYWVRLVRSGDVITAYGSPDGINWAQTGRVTVSMNECAYVGLAVCSVSASALCQAQFDNVSFTSSASVIMSPMPQLLHRYSFNESSGSTVHDAIGGVSGALHGAATFDGKGKVVLNGASGCYVSLPAGLLSGLSNVTLEAWVTNAVSPDNVALFSFDDGSQGGVGGGYLRYVLHDSGNARTFLELASSAGTVLAPATAALGNQSVHLVCLYSSDLGSAVIYTNGVLACSQSASVPISAASTNSAALGRSPWQSDPWLSGAIDEFRIYSGLLMPADIAASQALGAGELLTTNVALAVARGDGVLSLSWPVAASGFALETSPGVGPSPSWSSATNPVVVVGTNNQVIVPVSQAQQFFRLKR
jgi:alpha-L-fucosidase